MGMDESWTAAPNERPRKNGAAANGAAANGAAANGALHERDEQVLVQYGEHIYELPSHCPHKGAPLASGYLAGPFLRCPWHGATFDIRNGARLRGPVCQDLTVRKTPVAGPTDETSRNSHR